MEIPKELFRLDKGVGYNYAYFPKHPLANKSGKVYEHRYIAWLNNGRYLPDGCHVHHKDGDKTNNSPSNLQILTQLEHIREHVGEAEKVECFCGFCGKRISVEKKRKIRAKHGKVYCNNECASKDSRLFEVEKDVLEVLVWAFPTIKLAKLFNVSDKAIEKRCKLLGIEKPPRGFWAKKRSKNASCPSHGRSKAVTLNSEEESRGSLPPRGSK